MIYQNKSGVYGAKDFLNKCYEDCELMQYTGLKDKNGKEIYEGDIIKSVSEIVRTIDNTKTGKFSTNFYRVGWHQSGCWNLFKSISDEHIGITGITLSCLKYYEVVGNIYENTELLTDK